MPRKYMRDATGKLRAELSQLDEAIWVLHMENPAWPILKCVEEAGVVGRIPIRDKAVRWLSHPEIRHRRERFREMAEEAGAPKFLQMLDELQENRLVAWGLEDVGEMNKATEMRMQALGHLKKDADPVPPPVLKVIMAWGGSNEPLNTPKMLEAEVKKPE